MLAQSTILAPRPRHHHWRMRTVSLHLIPDADRVEISFPYDREIVGLVRTVTGRQWHRDRLRWSVPRVELDRLALRLGEVGIRLIVAVAGSGAADAPAGADGTGRPGQDAPSGPGSDAHAVATGGNAPPAPDASN